MRFLRTLALAAVLLALAFVAVGWNLSRFLSSTPKIREKDISFLPAPAVAELLCLGHRNTVAKLRWIDSFAYFEYQLDHKDDRVAGGGTEGGFTRLYSTLITLDPHFQPFYEHAALNLGGLLGQQSASLGFLMTGIGFLPDSSLLWRNASAILRMYYHWQEKLPVPFASFLTNWRAAIPADSDQITIWMINIGRYVSNTAEQAAYWLEQLRATKEGSTAGNFVEQKVRIELAKIGVSTLETLVRAWRIAHGAQPTSLLDLWQDSDLIDPLALARPGAGEAGPERLEEVLQARLLRRRYPQENQAFGPIAMVEGHVRLRTDPFGLPWRLEAGRVVSTGMERLDFENSIAMANAKLLSLARAKGHWPSSLEEALAMGVPLPEAPPDGRLVLSGEAMESHFDGPSGRPWKLR